MKDYASNVRQDNRPFADVPETDFGSLERWKTAAAMNGYASLPFGRLVECTSVLRTKQP